MQLRWMPEAAADMEEINHYLSLNAPSLRHSTMLTLFNTIDSLREMPYRGRVGLVAGTREITFSKLPYVVTYRVDGDLIKVVNLSHTSRDRVSE